MRLSSIKLAGFKSFVDPTHFHVPGQLVGVVGPNGCGKSNIIDAVRWVLGESKASELRGESMQDVIFNGSTNRKPASRASVELIFDNADGGAGGQWSQYAEISVKRVLTRDGNSSYYINNQVVRRRDIQDIFMGTGLGPRAYAIIGQGMISRIIEARPEELRIFLEEAAGVSKYKERRRDTENRLQDTRENLTRVEDILRELNNNLEKLQGQAVVAQQYRDLQSDGEEKQKLLWLLRKKDAQVEQEKLMRDIERAQIDLEAQIAELRQVEAEIEHVRASQYEANDRMAGVQGAYYEANSEVSRLEAEIRFVVDSRNRAQAQLTALVGQREQWQNQTGEFELALEDANLQLAEAEEKHASSQDSLASQADAVPEMEAQWRDQQTALTSQRNAISQAEQAIKLESLHQKNASDRLQALTQRRERLTQESRNLDAPDATRLEELRALVADEEDRKAELEAQLGDKQAELEDADSARKTASQRVTTEAANIAQLEARLSALKQLQEKVQVQEKVQPWLAKHELAGLPRLWQRLDIEAGWEAALESSLRERFAALELSNLDWAKAFLGDLPPAKLSFVSPAGASSKSAAPVAGLKPFMQLLKINDAGMRGLMTDWLAQVYVAESLAEALQERSKLPAGAMFIVREGHVVTEHSLSLYAADSEQAGMLARQHEIDNLGKLIRAQQIMSDEARTEQIKAEAAYSRANEEIQRLRGELTRITQQLHQHQLELQKLAQAQQQHSARSTQIQADLEELAAEEETQRAIQSDAEANFETLDGELAELQMKFEDAQMAFETLDAQLSSARDKHRELERSAQQADFDIRNIHNRINNLKNNLQQNSENIKHVIDSIALAEVELAALVDESARAGLQEALEIRSEREQALTDARTELDSLNHALRGAEEKRMQTERTLDPLRQKIVDVQMKEQAARLNIEQFDEQLRAVQADELALAEKLDPNLKAPYLQGEVTRINNAINALGAVNLAALDELNAATERKTFLDSQNADLVEAMTTLEDAISRIDKETRGLLKDTFDKVNEQFGELFPGLFGGGQAKLVMTGEEILDSGVQVMAQPPGKKNSTIHLLSGGEKALTAIALVFSLFQLNPAPFCLLDEVDAPLDDANTERYARIVKKMSSVTQFLFISHNKIAMEMAQQLIGVTMQEQGVSRIVAVDMEAAVNLTDAMAA
ncbi:chromosome segregation protein SMC [Ampullimonas aquatilis]|uniref:chromosome segregation protein SMC n=1 Tax=Ampullimonas aquatilis TaxID=1341549 RepID=UPI003C70C994